MPLFITELNETDILFSDGTRQSSSANPVFRNRVINGTMKVARYGNTQAALTYLFFAGCDRFPVRFAGFSTLTGTISQASVGGSKAQQAQITTTGSGTMEYHHRIEQSLIYDLHDCSVSLQFEFYQNTGSDITIGYNLTVPSAYDVWTSFSAYNGGSLTEQTAVIPSGVVTKVTHTFVLDEGGTSPLQARNGLGFMITVPIGAVTSKVFQLLNVQLEKSIYPTDVEYVPVTIEEMRCQRYFDYILVSNVNEGRATSGVSGPVKFRQQMRATPTNGGSAYLTTRVLVNAPSAGFLYLNNIGGCYFTPSFTTGACGVYNESVGLSSELV